MTSLCRRLTFISFASAMLLPGAALADQVISDDLITDGSLCVGVDCVNGESFGFDTIRLKENNLRIRFVDTSASASFPTNDWQITANDSSNGGENKFSIDDIDGGRTPFTVEAGAKSHALYVDNGGRVGFGTKDPAVELHSVDGDSPTLRLEQDGSSGFTAQTWDIAGNETNFFVRDATNGSLLPFKIFPSAPSDSLTVSTKGVGIGTKTADAQLDVKGSAGKSTARFQTTSGPVELQFIDGASESATLRSENGGAALEANAFSVMGAGQDFTAFEVDGSTGRVDVGGELHVLGLVHAQEFEVTSSRRAKENVEPVRPMEVLSLVKALAINSWNYIHDPLKTLHMGPMAEDFFKAFGLGKSERHLSLADVTGVLFAAVQGLSEWLEAQGEAITMLEAENLRLAKENKDLERRVERLERLITAKN